MISSAPLRAPSEIRSLLHYIHCSYHACIAKRKERHANASKCLIINNCNIQEAIKSQLLVQPFMHSNLEYTQTCRLSVLSQN